MRAVCESFLKYGDCEIECRFDQVGGPTEMELEDHS
jgi:hypothetical protein